MVGDRYFVRVSSEIVDRFLRPAEGGFAVDDPVLLARSCDVPSELSLVVERLELSVEVQPGLIELFEEETAKESGQDTNWEEEVLAAPGPTLAVWTGPAAGNDAVHVRMMQEVLAPGMKDREEADARAEVFGVCSDGEECSGTGGKEDVVNRFFVLQC